jgi:hypothetical protein
LETPLSCDVVVLMWGEPDSGLTKARLTAGNSRSRDEQCLFQNTREEDSRQQCLTQGCQPNMVIRREPSPIRKESFENLSRDLDHVRLWMELITKYVSRMASKILNPYVPSNRFLPYISEYKTEEQKSGWPFMAGNDEVPPCQSNLSHVFTIFTNRASGNLASCSQSHS